MLCNSHRSRSMRSEVYGTVHPFASLSVPPCDRSCGALRVCCCAPCVQERSIDSGGRRTPASSSAAAERRALSSKRGQCHVDSRRRKLNTDSFKTDGQRSTVKLQCRKHRQQYSTQKVRCFALTDYGRFYLVLTAFLFFRVLKRFTD